jgi:hypothetical protein
MLLNTIAILLPSRLEKAIQIEIRELPQSLRASPVPQQTRQFPYPVAIECQAAGDVHDRTHRDQRGQEQHRAGDSRLERVPRGGHSAIH